MSTASRLRHPKQPSPESGRPRLRGKTTKPAPLDITTEQNMLHILSSKQALRSKKTKGAFGGCAKDERVVKALIRRLGK